MARKEDWYSPGSITAKIASWSFRESKSAQKRKELVGVFAAARMGCVGTVRRLCIYTRAACDSCF